MITLAQLRAKALRYWDKQRIFRSEMGQEVLFPLVIPFAKVSVAEALGDFSRIRETLTELRQHSKEALGYGVSITWKQSNTRSLGPQSFPQTVAFETAEDLCRFVGKAKPFERWKVLRREIEEQQPALRAWIGKHPIRVLDFDGKWPQLLAVVAFFQRKSARPCYLRQLEIEGVDSKFIEQHRLVLQELFTFALPAPQIPEDEMGKPEVSFEERYCLLRDEPLIRFRLLDPLQREQFRFSDLSVPLTDFKKNVLPVSRVFITENKVNGLSFPDGPNSLVIFGLGYGINLLRSVEWLSSRDIFYWGDIDTHGFSILSQVRSFLPRAHSFLMDRPTLLAAKAFWGREPDPAHFTGLPENLTREERELFDDLRLDRLGPSVRLEQERVPFPLVRAEISRILSLELCAPLSAHLK